MPMQDAIPTPTKKVLVSVLGYDRPGIIAAITRILFDLDCNIENVSQTLLQSQFAGIFIAAPPPDLNIDTLRRNLEQGMAAMGLQVHLMPFTPEPACFDTVKSQPFVITTQGPDRKGLVAGITEVLARHGINVTHLQAVFKGGEDPGDNVMIYEVDVPDAIDWQAFHPDLRNRAAELHLTLSIQHRNIFEAINRI